MADSFTLAFASCLNAPDSEAFNRIRLLSPQYFYGAGDLWYDDGASDHVAHWNAFFAASKVAAMVAALPNPPIIGWSDRDFGFASNSVAGSMTTTANTAYRTKFGSTGLPTQGIYRTWARGRVRFILCDERSFKSPNAATDDAAKTVLGATQKAWLKNLLASNVYPLIVVLGDTPWVGAAAAGDDGWKGYATEREELRQAYATSPAQVIRLNGDMHCLAVGRDQFGIDRVWQAAPLRNDTKVKDGGAGYTATYPINANEGAVEELFGVVTVDDTDTAITATFRGYSSDGTQRLTDSLVVSTPTSTPTPTPPGSSPYVGFPDGVAYPAIGAGSMVVNVSSSAALTTALTNAAPGQRIVLANGTYSGAFAVTGKAGTGSSGITIEAATTGGAVFGSGSTFTVKDSAHVTLKGLAFPYELSSGNLVQFRGASHHCRITRCLFGPTSVGTSGTAKSPMIYGGDTVEFIRVDHNEFRNKANPGNTILFDGNFTTSQVVKHIRIDHNYLHDIRPEVTNEKEPIRFGVSTMSKTSSYSVIERNLLVACICEPENISVKACNVRVTGNAVLRSIGGIVYRHGTDGVVSDNYIVDRVGTFGTTIGSGGFRFYDKNHEISYNYVDGVYGGNFQGPLVLDTGDAEGSSTNLSAHWRVVNATVKRNVLVGNPEGIRIGNNYGSAPTGCTIADNLVAQAPTGVAITQRIAPVSTTQTGNLYGSTPAAIGLAQGPDTIWRRVDYGPRLTYLQPADVGVSGDLSDLDGTGALVGAVVGGGGGGGGPQALGAVSIASGEQIGVPAVTIPDQAPGGSVPTRLGQNLILGSGTLGWTLSAVPPDPAGNQTVIGAGRIRSEQAFGVPSFTVPPGDQTITASSIPPGTTFGGAVISAIPAFPPAPGGVLVPALYAVGRDGTTLTPLPGWTKIHLSPVANSAGSLSVDYPAGTPGFALLHDAVSASPLRALEIRIWLGGSNSAALGGWLVQKSGDDLTPGSSWTFSGHFHEWLLSKALVYPQTISEANKTGALTFVGATAGLILSTIMTQAQARGALPLVTRDFTATHDSNGTPWTTSISSAKFAPKTKVSEIADKLVDLDMVEYELTPARMWRAYNPGGRGVDRTAGTTNPLSFTATVNLRERARRESARDAGTAILVAGAEGFYGTASSATAQAELGWRAEVAADAGQLNSQSAVTAVTASYLEAARTGTAEFNSGVEFVPGQPLPLIDYGVGDWAYVRAGARYERQRIAQIELDFAEGALPTGTIVQNDLITDKVTALYRRLNAISAGDAVVGTSESTPGGAGEDVNPPAAPTGVTVASSFAYQVPGESLTLAEIGVGWAPVTTNAYVDDVTAGKAAAATVIGARFHSSLPVAPNWQWIGQSSVVTTYGPALLDEWVKADAPGGIADPTAWLDAYPAAHQGGGAVTGDVDHYRVQFQYLGATQVNTKGPRGEDFPDQLQPDGAWEEPINSPTTQTALTFGNVEGGRAVGVRVAAVDRSGNQGPWSTVVAVDSAKDDKPPPTPSRPIAAAWFRTMDITWDGKGSTGEDLLLAAPDFASGGYVEVHVDLGIDFDPDRPVGATGQVDLSASRTFKERLYAAGTTNVVDLQVGTTYFARFVAVDRNGNASPPSETSDGVLPKQLVNIDIGPDAVGRLQIIDGEIVRAKIADLAVNSAKIEEVNVGLLRAGTMTANVVIGGRFSTPMVNGNQVQIDNAGIRLYQGNTVIGRWQVSDASMLITGTYLSALQGKRINILPSGTIQFYPSAGTNWGFIENLDGDIRMSGQINQDQRAGYLLIDETRAALTYSQITTYNNPRTRFQVDPIAAASWAPIVSTRINRSLDSDPLGPRWLYTNFSTSGDVGSSIVHLQQVSAASNHAVMYGANSDAGFVFDAGFIAAVHNNINPADVHASGFIQVSALAAKRDVAPVRFGGASAARITQLARARSFYYHHEFEARPESPGTMLRRFDDEGNDLDPVPGEWTHPPRRPVMHVGPMADDLLAVAPQIVHTDLPQRGTVDNGGLGLSIGTVAGLAYAAAGELADAHDALAAQVAALQARLDRLDHDTPIVVDGTLLNEPTTEDS